MAAGGPKEWNDKKIRISGSNFYSGGGAVIGGKIVISTYLEMQSFDEELAELRTL